VNIIAFRKSSVQGPCCSKRWGRNFNKPLGFVKDRAQVFGVEQRGLEAGRHGQIGRFLVSFPGAT